MMVQCEGKNIAKPSSDEKPWESAWSKTHLDLPDLHVLGRERLVLLCPDSGAARADLT